MKDYLAEYNAQHGIKNSSVSSTPKVKDYLAEYNANPPKQIKVTPTPKVKPAPTLLQTTQKKIGEVSTSAKNIVKKISDTLSITFTKPKLVSPVPQQNIIKPQPITEQVKALKPVTITPNQKKLTKSQLTQIQPSFTPQQAGVSAQLKPKEIEKTKLVQFLKKYPTLAVFLNREVFQPVAQDPLGFINAIRSPQGDYLKFLQQKYPKEYPVTKQTKGQKLGAITGNILGFLTEAKTWTSVFPNDLTVPSEYYGGKVLTKLNEMNINATELRKALDKIGVSPDTSIKEFDRLFKERLPAFAEVYQTGGTLVQQQEAKDWNIAMELVIHSKWYERLLALFKTGGKETVRIAGLIPEQTGLPAILKVGENTPQEIINTVMKSGQETTKEGKALISSAVQAQQSGQNIIVNKILQPQTGGVGGMKVLYHGTSKFNAEAIKKAGKFTNMTSGIDWDAPVYFSSTEVGAKTYSIKGGVKGDVLPFDVKGLRIATKEEATKILGNSPNSYFYLPVSNKNSAVLKLKAAGFDGANYTSNKDVTETIIWNKEKLKLLQPQTGGVVGGVVSKQAVLPKEEKTLLQKQVQLDQEKETTISKEVDSFVKDLDKDYGEEGFVGLPTFKKPDLEKLNRFIKKIGTREEQIGEDAFWQQQLFEAKKSTNIRDITREVQEKFVPEKIVNLISKIPYVDRDAVIRISRSLQRLNFIKERKRQQLLYKTASAIKGLDENGLPIFGTKIQKVLDNGIVKEDWRYTPEEAKLLWNKLSIRERKILTEYIAPLEKAKSIFSRELLKQKAGVEKGVEGYIHRYYEDRIGDRFRKIFFKFRKASPTKTRTRFVNPETGKVEELTGNVENFEKSVIKQMENVTNAQEYNKFIQIWQDLLTEPLNNENPLKKGWVEVRGTLKTGIPTDKPRIFKTEEGYGLAPQVRRQTPITIKEMYMKGMGDASESYAFLNAIKSVSRYWQGNVLIYPGTAATNAISGGLQYGTKIITDFYKEGVFSGNFKPFFTDIFAIIDAVNPNTIERLRPELIGAKVNIATQFGKPKNFLDKYLELGLTPFGMVETYWKRVIVDATLRGIGKKPEDILPEYETFKKVAKESDIYGFNYSNIPQLLENWRGSTLGSLIFPFPVYPYKYIRLLERYSLGAVKEIFTGSKKEGFARLFTLASVISIIYFFIHKTEEKVGEYVDEMKYPGEFDKTGRFKISETDQKESYFRVIKYPWLNFMKVLQAGGDILKGYKEKGIKQISGIGQEFISEGPLLNMTNLLLGNKDKFSLYKPESVLLGEVVKSFIPAFRINESISFLIDPTKTKQETFEQAIERALLIKPSGEVRTGFGDKELQYNQEEEWLKFVFGINIRSIDRKGYEEARNQVIQNMVYRIKEDEDISDKSKKRAIEVLKIFNVEESQYGKYLKARKKRLKKSRKKKK